MSGLPILDATFNSDNALPDRRQHFADRELIGDPVSQPNALQSGARHDQRVSRTDGTAARKPLHFRIVQLAHARVRGAPIVDHLDFRKQPARIGGAAHRVSTELEAATQRTPDVVNGNPRPEHQNIAGRVARQRRPNHQAGRVFIARHIL